MGRLFRNPNFLRLYLAGVLSIAGATLTGTILPWVVYVQTGSAYDLALLGVVAVVPTLALGLLAGALVDRTDRRRLMIISDLGRAAIVAALVVGLWIAGFSLLLILAAVVLVESLSTLFRPAGNAFLPNLVPIGDLEDANGLLTASYSASQVVGAALAGILIATAGELIGLTFNVATYVLSALLLSLIVLRVTEGTGSTALPRARARFVEDLREGFRYFRSQPVIYELTIAGLVLNFLVVMAARFLVVYSRVYLSPSAVDFGLLSASLPAGLIVGALMTGRVHATRRAGWSIALGVGTLGAVIGLLPALPYLPLALLLLAVGGAAAGVVNTAYYTVLQAIVPNQILGRVLSVDEVGGFAALPLAPVVGGLLIASYGVGVAFYVAGLGTVVTALVMALSPRIRRLRLPAASAS